MFCRNCGTDVTNMKYCPKCGTPAAIVNENLNTGAKVKSSKTNRKYVLAILCVGIVLLGIAIAVLLRKPSTETVSDHINNDITSKQTSQATEESQQEQQTDIDYDWWKDRCYKAANVDETYLWVNMFENDDDRNVWFVVGTWWDYQNPDESWPHVAARVSQEDISVTEEYIQYTATDKESETVIRYFFGEDRITLVSKIADTDRYYNYSDTYLPMEEEAQSDEVYEETDVVPELMLEPRYYECFETQGGWDAEIAIYPKGEGQINVDIVRIAGGELSLDSKDENSSVYTGYWDDFNSEVSLIIIDYSPEITFTATGELEQYNGTYIQLPDVGTDGEN